MSLILSGTDGLSDVDGSAATPAIRGTDANTGIFFPAADTIAFSEGGVEAMRIDSSGNLGIGTSSPGAKLEANDGTNYMRFAPGADSSLTVNGATGLIINSATASTSIKFRVAGDERMRIDSSGNLLVGDTATVSSARFYVKSAGSSAGSLNSSFRNSASSTLLAIRDDGYIATGTAGASPYNATTGNAANLHVLAADGGLYRSVSSIKYKTNVQNATHGLFDLLKLRPVSYQGINEIDGNKTFGGLIAEEVHEAGLTEFVQYAKDGSPDALSYGNMVSLCIKAIQEMKTVIDEQAQRISVLEAK
jgi:hypothetical protein